MKGASATRLDQKPTTLDDGKSTTIRAACAASDPRVLAAQSDLQRAEADAKAAADLAANEKDNGKVDADKKLADDKEALVKGAKDKLDTILNAASNAGSTYALTFYLDPQLVNRSDTRDAWIQLVRKPWNEHPIAVSVGPESGAWPSQVTIAFERLNLFGLAGWAVLFVCALVLFVKYARDSDIIRDTGTLSNGGGGAGPGVGTPGAPAKRKTYSLARTQMAVWTFVVAGALAFIFLVTWNENAITSGVLGLLGLSFGTSLLAAVSDGTQPTPQETKGFMADLLSDGDGPSFHRYQMVLFTVILVIIFVVKVATNMVMPEFDATLLGLMGISNGTYIGFKLQNR